MDWHCGICPAEPCAAAGSGQRIAMGGEFTFARLGDVVDEALADLRDRAVRGWDSRSFVLFDEKIELPLLDLDYAAIRDFRDEAVS
ncbi:hypothetical protein FLP41_14270 [Paracoccus marcusii]|uniref:hypothetical protein n=1 Tax=Paracoccus marcusii TaxID=59779 RepID=UPI002ECFB039|nr:hypothetical protein FLP41_14270 [Paracoccus marcusii]